MMNLSTCRSKTFVGVPIWKSPKKMFQSIQSNFFKSVKRFSTDAPGLVELPDLRWTAVTAILERLSLGFRSSITSQIHSGFLMFFGKSMVWNYPCHASEQTPQILHLPLPQLCHARQPYGLSHFTFCDGSLADMAWTFSVFYTDSPTILLGDLRPRLNALANTSGTAAMYINLGTLKLSLFSSFA